MGLAEDVKLSAYWEATQYFSFCLVIYFYSFQDKEISAVPKGGSHTYTPGCTFPSLFSYLYYSHAIEDNVIQVGGGIIIMHVIKFCTNFTKFLLHTPTNLL